MATTLPVLRELYVDGRFVPSRGEALADVHDSATEEVVARVVLGTREDADAAVAAASRAFPDWAARPLDERLDALASVADGLAARREELARAISSETGMPLRLADSDQAAFPVDAVRAFVRLAREMALEERVGHSVLRREPVGVVAGITPWNYPLYQAVLKAAPALAMGCTLVLKPSEVAPLSAFVLAEVIAAAGLPSGVFNLVTGLGPEVGEALASHPDVDMVSFTGSTRAGRRVAELAAATVKRVSLELGGKSANVLLDDADLAQAVPAGVRSAFPNSGQNCAALTRLLVPADRLEEAEALAVEEAGRLRVGDPQDAATDLGPLASALQRDRVRELIGTGIREGARLLAGGPEPPEGLERGYYVRPTVFTDVAPAMTIAQTEVFGPVLCLMPYEDEEDAVRIANGTIYGLAGAVWSADPERALGVARRLRTGRVDVNGAPFNLLAPTGGYKQSGLGRELGRAGLEEFSEIKSVQLPSFS